jgi:hypothetical protein
MERAMGFEPTTPTLAIAHAGVRRYSDGGLINLKFIVFS